MGGSETWVRTMVHELKRQWFNVDIFTFHRGYFSELLEREGFKIISSVNELSNEYTAVIGNHTTTINAIKSKLSCPIIFTSHSFFIDIEQPTIEADEYVAVTEEIKTKENQQIIRNGIDLNKFKWQPINRELKNILYLTHPWNKKGLELVKNSCQGYNLITINEPILDTEKIIHQADLVITLGRGILEGLACGRNVISGDHRDWMDGFIGGGMITKDNFDELKTHALSGRNKPIHFTAETLRDEIQKYNPNNVLRKKIEQEYNIKKQVHKYIKLIQKYV